MARNNLTNRAIIFREGGQAQLLNNVPNAKPNWFVDPAKADLRLTALGMTLAADAGAFEVQGALIRASDHRGGIRLLSYIQPRQA